MSKQKTTLNDEALSQTVGGSGIPDGIINLVDSGHIILDRQENSISLSTNDGKCGYDMLVVDGICQSPQPYLLADGTKYDTHPCYGCKYYKLTPKN